MKGLVSTIDIRPHRHRTETALIGESWGCQDRVEGLINAIILSYTGHLMPATRTIYVLLPVQALLRQEVGLIPSASPKNNPMFSLPTYYADGIKSGKTCVFLILPAKSQLFHL